MNTLLRDAAKSGAFRLFLFTTVAAAAWGQAAATQNPATQAPVESSAQPPPPADDRFPALRDQAARLRTEYTNLDQKNMAEVDALLRTNRCQINRVSGLLDRTMALFDQYIEAELKYWQLWNEAEQKRVDDQQVSLARMEADQKRVAEELEIVKQDREALIRRRTELEKYGKRSEEIRYQMDSLLQDIQDSDKRLTNAQKQFEELTIRISNMSASITARLTEIRQNKISFDSYRKEQTAYYEQRRATANEICNAKQPTMKKAPLPKRGSK